METKKPNTETFSFSECQAFSLKDEKITMKRLEKINKTHILIFSKQTAKQIEPKVFQRAQIPSF